MGVNYNENINENENNEDYAREVWEEIMREADEEERQLQENMILYRQIMELLDQEIVRFSDYWNAKCIRKFSNQDEEEAYFHESEEKRIYLKNQMDEVYPRLDEYFKQSFDEEVAEHDEEVEAFNDSEIRIMENLRIKLNQCNQKRRINGLYPLTFEQYNTGIY